MKRLVLSTLCLLLAFAAACPAAPVKDDGWSLELGPDATFFPALVVAAGTLRLDTGADPRELGDANGLLGVSVVAPRDGAKAQVELASASGLVAPSSVSVTLPKKGVRYAVYPFIKYNAEQMVLIRQPFAETVTARLTLDGAPMGEKSGRVTVRSINDCVYGYDEDGRWNDTSWLFAAYVNENHPAVEGILKDALATGKVDSIAGYQGDADDVRDEIEAVWTALARRRIRYSSIKTASAESPHIWSQHVRLLGEALAARQANCVEGSCLLASVFAKMGLKASLVNLPDHMLVAVDLDDDGDEDLYLETTLLGDSDSSFDDAAEAGEAVRKKYKSKLKADPRIRWRDKRARRKGGPDEVGLVNISMARELGILPIREPGADRARFRQ
ncbi:hypothetical protein [Solidesulfovibrio sp.]|uniref:hypothetical protein n=1 Tax=Solidesulfovibrio sp. TaxID=2910990 RepID=UPI00261BACF5|nr:hypothetical protein [Solidesulfovibrio sp.]